MCGRYSITTPVEGLRQVFLFEELPNLEPRYNVAPTQAVPAVRLEEDGRRHLRPLRWGLIPAWAKDAGIANKLVNARSETAAEKPAFRSAFRRRRCLLPADGFYEWRTEKGQKQPYRVVMADGSPFAFAGLWESWSDPAGGEVETSTILTTEANGYLAAIHNRMPVILPPEAHAAWLDPASDLESLKALMKPLPDAAMTAWPVDRRVNRVANDDPDCIAAVGESLPHGGEAAPPPEVEKKPEAPRGGSDERQGSLF